MAMTKIFFGVRARGTPALCAGPDVRALCEGWLGGVGGQLGGGHLHRGGRHLHREAADLRPAPPVRLLNQTMPSLPTFFFIDQTKIM